MSGSGCDSQALAGEEVNSSDNEECQRGEGSEADVKVDKSVEKIISLYEKNEPSVATKETPGAKSKSSISKALPSTSMEMSPTVKERKTVSFGSIAVLMDKSKITSMEKSSGSMDKSFIFKGKSSASMNKSFASIERIPASKENLNAPFVTSLATKDTSKCTISRDKDTSNSRNLDDLVSKLSIGEMKNAEQDVCDSTCETFSKKDTKSDAKDKETQVEKDPIEKSPASIYTDTESIEKPQAIDFFLKRVTIKMVLAMVKDANEKGMREDRSIPNDWKNITSEELYRFFGLTMLMLRHRRIILSEYWSEDPVLRSEIFLKTMSEKRYRIILNNIQVTHTGNEYPSSGMDFYFHIPHEIRQIAMFLNDCLDYANSIYESELETDAERLYFRLNVIRQILDKSNIQRLKEKQDFFGDSPYEEDKKLIAEDGKSSLDDTSHQDVQRVYKPPIDYFLDRVTPEMVSAITAAVNNAGMEEMERSTSDEWEDLTDPELYRFFALTMLMIRSVRISLSDYWSEDPLLPLEIFSKTMSEKRYRFLLRRVELKRADEYPEDDESYYSHIPVEIRYFAKFLINRLMEAQLNYDFDNETDANISHFELEVIQQLLNKFSENLEENKSSVL